MAGSPKLEDEHSIGRESLRTSRPEAKGGSGIMQEDDGFNLVVEDEDLSERSGDGDVPAGQSRPMTDDEKLDKSLEETFPTSDPIGPSRIEGPDD